MAENNYPDLSYSEVFKIQKIKEAFKKDADYIKNSPYSEATKNTLNTLFNRNIDSSEKIKLEDVKEIDLEKETTLVYLRLKELMDTALDNTEEARILKDSSNILEKLLGYAERARNLRYISDLERTILKVVKILPEESRTEVINILKMKE